MIAEGVDVSILFSSAPAVFETFCCQFNAKVIQESH